MGTEDIRGFKKMTYAVSKNVVRDAFNSFRIFVLSSLNLKNFSISSPFSVYYWIIIKKSYLNFSELV